MPLRNKSELAVPDTTPSAVKTTLDVIVLPVKGDTSAFARAPLVIVKSRQLIEILSPVIRTALAAASGRGYGDGDLEYS